MLSLDSGVMNHGSLINKSRFGECHEKMECIMPAVKVGGGGIMGWGQ